MTKNLSAVIIDSRTDRHFKTPVPLLPFGDQTVLGRTVASYLDAGFEEVIVHASSSQEDLASSLGSLLSKVRVVYAESPEEPMGTALRRACEEVSPSRGGFVIGMGDQPLIDASLIEQLTEKFASSNAKILVPVCQGQLGHPVFFDISLISDFKKLTPPAELWDVLKSRSSLVFDHAIYNTSILRHVDDLEDYHDMLRIAGLPVPEQLPTGESGESLS